MGKQKANLTGQRYGEMTVVSEAAQSTDYKRNWTCQCSCGNAIVVSQDNLVRGRTKSCGCQKKSHSKHQLVGEHFGRLTVLHEGRKNAHYERYWFCRCECGEVKEIKQDNLLKGRTKSCGCLKKEKSQQQGFKLREIRVENVYLPSLARELNRNNRTGVKGVSVKVVKGGTRYVANINVDKKRIYLGTFDTLEEAANYRRMAEEKFHQPYLEQGEALGVYKIS